MPPIPAVTFKTTTVTPPTITRNVNRESPYAPKELVPGWYESLKEARIAADADPEKRAWIATIDGGLGSEQSARAAIKRQRDAIVAHAGKALSNDTKTVAARTWEDGEKWYFALQIRPGALNL